MVKLNYFNLIILIQTGYIVGTTYSYMVSQTPVCYIIYNDFHKSIAYL